jgi:hypothetical protein
VAAQDQTGAAFVAVSSRSSATAWAV